MPIRRTSDLTRVKQLNEMPLFSACTNREIQRIESVATELHVVAGRVLTVAGRPGREFFVVLSGTATVWRQGIMLDRVGPGSFFGELSLLDRKERSATVIADTDMQLLVLTLREFKSTQFFIPPVINAMLTAVGERLRRANEGWTRDTALVTRFDPTPCGAGRGSLPNCQVATPEGAPVPWHEG
jgi:CRP/FNR family cyclic AMP-dependent transcriptional regulator